ncbi:hypothetical protein CTAYLR_002171 [Chrysophaeum taylorii]|uniref:RING-type domain-containing protein n=1 Tax=Chrysophaeum taylorii TaxID=2483200 RepID=A0AAD7UN61_9STRA|nr:hypothetical protein CTAYLR_002171 [Chrysophaeum taylorii]
MSAYDDGAIKEEARRAGSFEICPICLQIMVDPAVLVPCEHRFCVACCTTYLRANTDTQTAPCPVCRTAARLADVTTTDGENLRQLQIHERHANTDGWLYFDVRVHVQTVNFGDQRVARHPVGEQALTPSARTPDLWEICDSCFFVIRAHADGLPAGSYVAMLHLKRLPTFVCSEPVHVTLVADDRSVRRRRDLDFQKTLQPGAWSFLEIGDIDLLNQGGFTVSVQADRRDWWKSGLIVDCVAVKPQHPNFRRGRSRLFRSCALS